MDDLLGKCWHNLNQIKIKQKSNFEFTYNWNSENGNIFLGHFIEIDETDSRVLFVVVGEMFV